MRLLLVLAAAVLVAAALLVSLTCTVWRDEVEQEIGKRLIEAALGREAFVVVSMMEDLSRENEVHYAVACAGRGAQQDPEQIAAALQLPSGDWTVAERGRIEDTPYVILYDAQSPPHEAEFLDWRELSQAALTCVLPAAS